MAFFPLLATLATFQTILMRLMMTQKVTFIMSSVRTRSRLQRADFPCIKISVINVSSITTSIHYQRAVYFASFHSLWSILEHTSPTLNVRIKFKNIGSMKYSETRFLFHQRKTTCEIDIRVSNINTCKFVVPTCMYIHCVPLTTSSVTMTTCCNEQIFFSFEEFLSKPWMLKKFGYKEYHLHRAYILQM